MVDVDLGGEERIAIRFDAANAQADNVTAGYKQWCEGNYCGVYIKNGIKNVTDADAHYT